MRTLLHTALVFLSIITISSATPVGTEPIVSVEFTVIGWGSDITDLGYRNTGKAVPMNIQNFRRSETYRYQGSATLEFFRYASSGGIVAPDPVLQDPDYIPVYRPPSGPLGKDPVSTVQIPADTKRLLLLVAREGAALRVFALPDDETEVPAGKIRFLNLSPVRIGISPQTGPVSLIEPMGKAILTPSSADSVLVARIAHEKNGKWAILKDAMISAPKDAQTTVIFLRSEDKAFKSMDGQTLGPIQAFTLRLPVTAEPK